jgi:two-component system OmpR family response regulator
VIDARPLTALLIEDDARLADLTRSYLARHGVEVTVAPSGDLGLDLARRRAFDVVLLDLMLPGLDGLTVCTRLRAESAVPILMLSARGEEADRILGLELGADDYLPKPFSPRELLARIRAATRRAGGRLVAHRPVVAVGGLRLDPGALAATLDGASLDLTSHEFALLLALAQRAGRVLAREQLIELAGGDASERFDRSVDVHVSRLRAKLGDDPRNPRFIRTVRGVGYLFVEPRP